MNGKKAKIDEIKEEIKNCKQCRLCESRTNAIPPEGNSEARLMLVAQAPGKEEDKRGMMFIGPSGEVLDDLLEAAGVSRKEIWMTNLIKCMLPKYRKPKKEEIKICSQYLDREIEVVNPATIVPLGWFAARYIFKKYDIRIPNSKSEIFSRLVLAHNVRIYPLSHPATILYNKSYKPKIKEGYKKLRVLSRECKWYSFCPMKRFYEEGKIDGKWIQLYCKGDWESCIRYQLEEKGEPHPDWMLPDGTLDDSLR